MTPAFVDDLSDRLNPILVRDVRQGLRTRVFTASFALMLVVCVFVALAAWAGRPGFTRGRHTFLAFYFGLSSALLFLLPLGTFRSVQADRRDERWSTLALTTLQARQFVRGKVFGALVQGMLYASAAAPFLLFSYFLEGVSLVSVALVLALTLGAHVALVVLSTAWATFGRSGLARTFTLASLGVLLGGIVLSSMPIAEELLRTNWGSFDSNDLLGMAALALFAVTLTVALFELAASRLAPSNLNTAAGFRSAVAAHLLLMAALVHLEAMGKGATHYAFTLLVYASLVTFVVGAYGLGEQDAPPRLLRDRPWWQRPFLPGALGAFRFTTLLVVVTAPVLFAGIDTTFWPQGSIPFVALPAQVVLYLSLGTLAARGLLHRWLSAPIGIQATTWSLLAAGMLLPPIFMFVLGLPEWPIAWSLFSPIPIIETTPGSVHSPLIVDDLLSARIALSLAVWIAADRLLAAREAAARSAA